MTKAVFLDRDGVLIEDVDLLVDSRQVRILDGVPQTLNRLKQAGFELIVVTNQTVIARGLATEQGVLEIHVHMEQLIEQSGGPQLDGFYSCPHHPNATLEAYRADCDCRKPRPGLLLRAARERAIDLKASFLVGDRITDIIAGARAGCRTILVETGKHLSPPIETTDPLDRSIRPDHICADLNAAADWILGKCKMQNEEF